MGSGILNFVFEKVGEIVLMNFFSHGDIVNSLLDLEQVIVVGLSFIVLD